MSGAEIMAQVREMLAPVDVDRLTLAQASRMIADAVKDKRYRSSPMGALVGRYIRWFRNEYGATESSIRDYEAILARMAIHLCDRDPADVDREDLREVIDLWAARAPRTRAKVTSVIRTFWSWVEEQGIREDDPAAKIRRPRVPRKLPARLPADADERLLEATSEPRERVAHGVSGDLGARLYDIRAALSALDEAVR